MNFSLHLAAKVLNLIANAYVLAKQRFLRALYSRLEAPLAASSFNLHRDFYTSVYDIAFADETRAESACMGFGLERWLYAFVRQKGLDPVGWPDPVRAALTAAADPAG